jgi:hypothetical protein
MYTLHLETDGTIKTIPPGSQPALLAGLARQVALAHDYTLRSFFKMLTTYDTLVHLNTFFPDLINQYHQGQDQGSRINGVDRLVIGKTVEMVGLPGETRLEIYRTFTGRCGAQEVYIKDYQVDMLLDTPLKLGRLRHIIFGDCVDVFKFKTVYTLFEFVDGIGWELGFHGTPRQCQIRR